MNTPLNMRMFAAMVFVAAVTTNCSKGSPGSSSPTSPTPGTPSTSAVSLSVQSVSGTSERTSTGYLYHVTFTLKENGGRAGARVTSVRLDFFNGSSSVGGSTFPATDAPIPDVSPGGSVDSRRLNVTDDRAGVALADRVTVTVSYTATDGPAGTVTGGPGTVSAPGPAAPANCFTTTGNICMSVMSATVSCTIIPPGFESNCSAVLQVNIPTLITSGVLSFGIDVGQVGYATSTVVTIPNTSLGAMTLQIPAKRGGAGGCINGTDRRFVEVYDGSYRTSSNPGGRQMFVDTVPTTVTCR